MSRYNVWLATVMGPNCSNSLQIAEIGMNPKEIYGNRANLGKLGVFSNRQIKSAAETSIADTETAYLAHVENAIESVTVWDDDYPVRFRNMHDAPLVLFYKGDLSLLDSEYTVSVVGSRQCSGEGEKACQLIASDVARCGGVVVSGLAQGADTIAHKACVAAGGRTVAFTGVPLDECFPKVNEKFQSELARDHLVVSEYVSGQAYRGSHFIFRNRLIAMAGDALCVIQAKKKSGSLSTVNRAIEYDKAVFAVPGSIFSPVYEGSNSLLVRGLACAVTDGIQIMRHLGAVETTEKTEANTGKIAVSDSAQQVLKAIEGAMFPPRIAKKAKLPRGVVKAALIELEVAKLAEKTATGEYIRIG